MTDTTNTAEPTVSGIEYRRTGNQVVGADGTMVDEIEIHGVKHVSVTTTVPIDATVQMARSALDHEDGSVMQTDIAGCDY